MSYKKHFIKLTIFIFFVSLILLYLYKYIKTTNNPALDKGYNKVPTNENEIPDLDILYIN